MKSNCVLYKLVLSPKRTCILPDLPDSDLLEKALPGCRCSDLFVDGFSYKRLDLCSGFTAQGEQYRLLKQLKSAKYIADDLKDLPLTELLDLAQADAITLRDGYIGHTRQVSLAVQTAPLTRSDRLFGQQLQGGSLFCCYVKTENTTFPATIWLGEGEMALQEARPVTLPPRDRYVLQKNLPTDQAPDPAADPQARFKLTYDTGSSRMLLSAGSVFSRQDHFDRGVML